MSIKTLRNQVLALAGVYQACHQVKTLAWKGQCETTVLDTAVGSIFKLDAADLNDIYGGNDHLQLGLTVLSDQFDPQAASPDIEITRYVLNLFAIEKKLSSNNSILETLQNSINNSKTQLTHFGVNHPNTWASLADIYQNTISSLKPRILVNGERLHLSNNTNVTKIRSLLLAALRSVVLWRQCGGSRFSFLINRRNYYHEARTYLKTIPESRY